MSHSNNSPQKHAVWFGIVTFVAICGLTQLLTYQRYLINQDAARRALGVEMISVKDRLEDALSYSFSATKTLAYVVSSFGVPDDFDSTAKQIMESSNYIDALELTREGVITHVYPLDGNEVVIGYDVLRDPLTRVDAEQAIQKRALYFAGPLNLKQGGVAVIGRYPIFADDKFWGFSVALVKLSTLLDAAGIDVTRQAKYGYRLSRIDPITQQDTLIFTTHNPSHGGMSIAIDPAYGGLNLGVFPTGENESFKQVAPLSLLGFLLSLVSGVFVSYWLKAPQKQVVQAQREIISFLNRTNNGVVSLDKQWRVTFINRRANDSQVFHNLAIGKVIWDTYPEMKGTIFWDACQKAMALGEEVKVEGYYDRLNTWFGIQVYPSDQGITFFFNDTTEITESERKAWAEKQLSESIINSLPGIFYLYDRTGKFIRWNRNFETISGYSGSDIARMHPLDFFHPDEKELLRSRIEDVFANGSAEVSAHFFTHQKTKIPYYFTGRRVTFNGILYLIGMGIDITDRVWAENQSKESEQRYQHLIEQLSDAIIVTDDHGNNVDVNPSACILLGYTKTELLAIGSKDVLFDESMITSLPSRYAALKSGATHSMEYLLKRKDGTPVEVEVNSKRLTDGRFVEIIRDITERKKYEHKLAESENRLQTIMRTGPECIKLLDSNNHLEYMNPAGLSMLEAEDLEQVKGKSILELIDEPYKNSFSRLTQDVFGGSSGVLQFEITGLRGTKRWLESHAVPMKDPSGKIVSLLSVTRDVTERRRSEVELEKREKRFRALIENSTDIIVTLDKDLRPVYQSPSAERITGYSVEDRTNSALLDVVHRDDHLLLQKCIEESSASPGKPVPISFRVKHKSGRYIWLEGKIIDLFHDPNVQALVVNMRDVTDRKVAVEKLLASEKRFRALVENMSEAIELSDAKSRLIYQSPSVSHILGYGPQERIGKLVLDYVHPENKNDFIKAFHAVNKNHARPFSFQFRALHKNGNFVWLEGIVTNLLNDPSVEAMVSNYRDISERKGAEEKLKRERRLLRTLIDNIPDYVYVKDTHSRYLINNMANVKLMGKTTEEETLGKTVADFFSEDIVRPYHEDDQRVIQTGAPVTNREEPIATPEGGTRILLTTKVPLRDADGNTIGLVGVSRDITAQKQIEINLKNTNYFLESAQQVGHIGHWASEFGTTGRLSWSRETCRIFGIQPQEFDGRVETFFAFVHPDDRDEVQATVEHALANNSTYSIDHRIILRNGELKWVHEQGKLMADENNQGLRLIGVVQDITDQKKAEHEILTLNAELEQRVKFRTEQLLVANKEMEAFTYSVSHDLRSPLRIIDGYAQILIEDYRDTLVPEARSTLDIIMSNTRRMGQLIDDLLDFSRVGRADLRKVPVNMNEMVREVVQELRHSAISIPAQLHITDLAPAECDPNLIRQVWTNLVSNAIKYSSTKENPQVWIGMEQTGDKNVYFVSDNGAGFDMQYYHKLFGVFQRLHSHHEFSGTGVGLAIIQRIVLRHGGSVWAESKVNEGAKFFFTLD